MNNVEPVMSMSEIPEAAAGEKGKLRGTGGFVDPAFPPCLQLLLILDISVLRFSPQICNRFLKLSGDFWPFFCYSSG